MYTVNLGQQEVNFIVRKLRKAFSTRNKKETANTKESSQKTDDSLKETEDAENKNDNSNESDNNDDDDDDDFRCKEAIRYNKLRQKKKIQLPDINLDEYVIRLIC